MKENITVIRQLRRANQSHNTFQLMKIRLPGFEYHPLNLLPVDKGGSPSSDNKRSD